MNSKLWGGRFRESLHPLIFDFTKSIQDDWYLFEYEAFSNIAWVKQLYRLSLINREERDKIIKAIREIIQECSRGKFEFDFEEEDVHSYFYQLVRKKIGKLEEKLHAGKSRNEQIVTIVRMFLKDAILEEMELIANLQSVLLKKGEEYAGEIIPGFTHLQYAQPVMFLHWLLSYLEELERDKARLSDCYRRVDLLPLGAGALAGSNFNLDREELSRELGFSKIGRNSIDDVSDRDFILEYLNANVILFLHLSRLSEDLIVYNSPGYGFILFSDRVTTGSSLMPQKKNPDPLEIVRASASEALSSYVQLACLLKGLPSSYNRDLQLDKKALFRSYFMTTEVLLVLAIIISQLTLDLNRLNQMLRDEKLYLTDISEELIQQGLSWKEAHTKVGRLLRYAEERGKKIKELNPDIIQKILGKKLKLETYLDPASSIRKKSTSGSTNPKFVSRELKRWKKILLG